MKIEMIPINGIPTRCLVIEKHDASVLCENCGATTYNHELLAKEDDDWCMDCNDQEHRSGWTDEQMIVWTMGQLFDGKAVVIVKGDDEE